VYAWSLKRLLRRVEFRIFRLDAMLGLLVFASALSLSLSVSAQPQVHYYWPRANVTMLIFMIFEASDNTSGRRQFQPWRHHAVHTQCRCRPGWHRCQLPVHQIVSARLRLISQYRPYSSFAISPGNHSVSQSSFGSPCEPLAGGFDSGWVSVPESLSPPPEWNLTITDDSKRGFLVYSDPFYI
jgi:hypothetical protein